MKLIMENWKRYLNEGEVIPVDFANPEPMKSANRLRGKLKDAMFAGEESAVDLINQLEDAIGKELEAVYKKRFVDTPTEKYEDMEKIMGEIDDGLKDFPMLFNKLVKLFTVEELATR